MCCLPVPYYHSWEGRIVTPSGNPLKNATVIIKNYHSCASVGGAAPELIETISKRTDADGSFSIATIGINIDYFIFVAGCFGTDVSQYVCYQGKWESAKDIRTNNGVLQFDPRTARTDAHNLPLECSQMWESVRQRFPVNSELYLAIAANDYGHVKELIASGLGVNVDQYTPLMYSAELGNVKIADLLISSGSNIDAQDQLGKTALIIALEKYEVEAARFLINKNANVNLPMKWGGTPLSIACGNGFFDIVELLLKKGASVSVKGDNGRAVLSITKRVAKGSESDRMIKLLHSYGAHE